MSVWFVYMVRCADGSLYTGITTDLDRRMDEHNGIRRGGARYTRNRRPVELVWHEPSNNRSTASQREYEIKRLTRSAKLSLVNL